MDAEQSESLGPACQSACRLPKGYDLKRLGSIRGAWPHRELSQEELLETYKSHYSAGARREVLLLLDAFKKRYGDGIFEVVEATFCAMGTQDGETDQLRYRGLLEKLTDLIVRPHCCEFDVSEATTERIAYRVLKCPFADLAKEMDLEQIGSRICPSWHKAYAKAFGYDFSMPRFLLSGDECCEQVWERRPRG